MTNFTPPNSEITDEVLSIFAKLHPETTPEEGEKILAWCIGLSVGYRMGSLLSPHIAETMCVGFQLGAKGNELEQKGQLK